MANLIMARTKSTPYILFKEDGRLILEGRSFAENPKIFYSGLFEWVDKLNVRTVDIIFRLEYMYNSSTKMLAKLFHEIEKNKKIESIHVDWYYEEDDPDMEEIGKMIEENLDRTKFNYLKC